MGPFPWNKRPKHLPRRVASLDLVKCQRHCFKGNAFNQRKFGSDNIFTGCHSPSGVPPASWNVALRFAFDSFGAVVQLWIVWRHKLQ